MSSYNIRYLWIVVSDLPTRSGVMKMFVLYNIPHYRRTICRFVFPAGVCYRD